MQPSLENFLYSRLNRDWTNTGYNGVNYEFLDQIIPLPWKAPEFSVSQWEIVKTYLK